MDSIKRRNRLDLCTPAELAIYKAMEEVEKLKPDVKLTNAIVKLLEAKELVSDFVDEQPVINVWKLVPIRFEPDEPIKMEIINRPK